MSETVAAPIIVSVEIDNPELADRIASLLGGLAGLRLALPGEAASVAIVSTAVDSSRRPSRSSTIINRLRFGVVRDGSPANRSDCNEERNERILASPSANVTSK